MSMDLFCYSSKSSDEVGRIMSLLADQHKELFAKRFLISQVREAGAIQKEIALEHGLHAKSIFLIHYNDKSAVDLSSDVVQVVKTALGSSDVVILFENETLR